VSQSFKKRKHAVLFFTSPHATAPQCTAMHAIKARPLRQFSFAATGHVRHASSARNGGRNWRGGRPRPDHSPASTAPCQGNDLTDKVSITGASCRCRSAGAGAVRRQLYWPAAAASQGRRRVVSDRPALPGRRERPARAAAAQHAYQKCQGQLTEFNQPKTIHRNLRPN